MLHQFAADLRLFRPTPVAIILFVFATVRMAMSGSAIALVGVCAGIVPFMCINKRWPERQATEMTPSVMLADWACGLLFALIYLAWMLGVSFLASKLNPSYTANAVFLQTLLLTVASDVVFISAAYPVCTLVPKRIRLLPPLILINGQLGFMLLCGASDVATLPWVPTACAAFSALVLAVAAGFIAASGRRKAKA